MLCCEDERREEPRRSKDKVKNAEGSKLLEMIEENGWEILNGNTEGDEEGELTFIGGKGNSVIDYVIIDPLVKEEIKCFKVETRTESDHLPLMVEIYEEKLEADSHRKEKERMRSIWTEEGVNQYKERISRIRFQKEEVNEIMKELKQKIDEAALKKIWKLGKWRAGWKI